ncbi:Type IV secretion system protein TraW [Candidatus Bandiella woodruffii]|uniref:Type IV secretion system protein TraW n=1 Tax=Candidatus Bandiella euplotis TaxID=1664265 RepID=A0ABZ0UNG0_9RICK|nr:type-F conjugative transfer system protein TraW [Candidatus Bandiella woodruffii]WPX96375.1 Type IV secretion system protein TraW [Candidatus Bandiella woodruffii]
MKALDMLRIAILLGLFIQFTESFAKDFGVVGKVYEVAEENMLEVILNKLITMKESGEIERRNQDMREKLLSYLKRPHEVQEVIDAVEEREYYYDPSYVVEEDMADQEGMVFIRKGRVVNPLEYMPLGQKLIFINGDNKNQVDWALEKSKKATAKIIFTKGNLLDLMKESKRRLYFDQGGVLVRRFGIKQVPAVVEQDELRLLIKEVVIK